MIHYRFLALLLISAFLSQPAFGQINPFRGSRGTPLNADDLKALGDATEHLLDRPDLVTGGTETWSNSQSGVSGTITAGGAVRRKGLACRALSYQVTGSSPGPQRRATLTWCKTSDGWKIG